MFNKRHYQAIAAVCQEYRKHSDIFQTKAVRDSYQTELEQRLADMFFDDNKLFKRDLFMQACQIGSNVRATKVKKHQGTCFAPNCLGFAE